MGEESISQHESSLLCVSGELPDQSDMDLEQLPAQNSHLMAVLNYNISIVVKKRRGSDRVLKVLQSEETNIILSFIVA